MVTQLRRTMDAIRASAIMGGPRTSTSDVAPCLPHGQTVSPSSPARVSYGQSVATDVGISLPHPLSSKSIGVDIHRDRQTPITDVFREEEEENDDNNISLKELSQKLQEFADARDWEKYHTPRNLLLAMVGEVGELSEIFQWKGEVERGLEDWEEPEKEHLGEELSDVLLYLIRLADICGIDLAQASLNKILKNAIKYPLPPLDHS